MATTTTNMAAGWRRGLLAVAVALGAWFAATGSAHAAFGLMPDTYLADTFTSTGERETQAAAHPFHATTHFKLNLQPNNRMDGGLHDAITELPPGFSGNPQVAAECPRADYAAITTSQWGEASCPLASQVGFADITSAARNGFVKNRYPVYNLEPVPGYVATFGIPVALAATRMNVELDPANGYRLRVRAEYISQGVPVQDVRVTMWGAPASRQNDDNRSCNGGGYVLPGQTCSVTSPERPFLSNPSDCSAGPLTTDIAVDSWQDRGVWYRDSYTTPTGVTGCERLSFEPSAEMALSTTKPDAPSGLSVDLRFPQNDDPNRLDVPPLRDAEVTLPEGLTINPGSADGLEACTDGQLGLATDNPIGCPDGSKLGTVTAVSPALAKPLEGSAYLRTQASDDPASGEMFRMALVVEDPERGVLVKLPGSIHVNPDTGRITTKFRDNPQLPVSSLRLALKSGPRASLATPASCGDHSVATRLVAWSAHTVDLQSPLGVDCAAGLGSFQPTFTAGTESPVAGSSSPFVLRVDKRDGQSALDKVNVSMPQGLLANLRGMVGKRVGTARVAAGPGSNPFWLSGPVFLEGAYGDAPFSLRVSVPVKAGPFDLGEVTVRQRIYVDPDDASVRVVSDPLPTIVKGVPARLQSVAVQIDRPGFVLNPTSCARKQVGGTLGAVTGQSAEVSSRFQVGDCSRLAFTPKLAMRVKGKNTKTGAHPALKTTVTQPKGQASIRRADVTLPKSIVLDATNSADPRLLCGYDEALKADCPASSVIGKATAVTPVLDRPLSGDVHLVQGIKFGPNGNRIRTTPSLLVKLRGQVAINLRATTTVRNDRLVTTFPAVPDAPVSRFSLNIAGGKKGILVVTRTRRAKIDLCDTRHAAQVRTTGHNTKTANFATPIKTPCGGKAAKKAKRSKAKRRG